MIRLAWRRALAPKSLTLAALVAVSGCGTDGAPAVETSTALVTMTGSVTYKGAAVNEGEILFNPANVKRRDAPIATAPIKDGKYTIQAMVGENSVSARVPSLQKKDPSLAYASFMFEVPKSGGTYDLDLSKK